MSEQPPIKKTAQSNLNSVSLQELVLTLNEQTEELLSGGELSGGGKPKWAINKPHIN